MLLLAPVIAVAAVLIAILIAPPIAGLAWGAKTIDARLTVLGADFTHIPRFPERSTIYAADGKTVLATLYLDNREIVDLPDISEMGRKSVLAVEDAQFYEHGPLDWTSLIRALLTNAATGEVVQGGSTITQQLVKNAVTGDTSQTFQRKFQELALAIRVEQRYTKDQILSLYLNDVYFANGVYGIGTAADFYFHVPASKLKLTQSAMLAGLIRSPNYYDPLAHPVKARIRRNVVLDRLAELGWVPQERIDRAKASPLGLAPDIGRLGLRQPPFFVRYLTQRIVANEDGEFDAFGKTEKARRRRLYEGGLRITTTLDPDWQTAAQQVANEPYRESVANPNYEQTPDTAIVSVDNATGAIRTMLSGRNYLQDQVNLADAAPAAGIVVQAVHAGGGVPRRDPTRSGVLDQVTALPARVERERLLVRVERGGRRRRRVREPVGRHAELDQRRVRPADPGGRAREGGRGGARHGDRVRAPRGAVADARDRRRDADRDGVGVPDARERREALRVLRGGEGGRRRRRAVPAQAVVQAGRRARDRAPGDRDDAGRGLRRNGHRGRARYVAGRGQDRHDAGLHERVVRRVHPAGLDGGVGRLPRHAGSALELLRRVGVRRHARRADLARLHVARDGRDAGRELPRHHPRRRTAPCPTWSASSP